MNPVDLMKKTVFLPVINKAVPQGVVIGAAAVVLIAAAILVIKLKK